MWMRVLEVAVMVATGIVGGVLFGVALANVPSFQAMALERYVFTHQLLDRRYEPTLPLLVFASIVADLFLGATAPGTARRVLFTVAAALLLGVAGVSQFVNVPLLRGLREANADALPAGWPDPRLPWRRWHLVRTVLAVLALSATASAALIAPEDMQ
jgi:uncharacterized membrane protein